MKTLVLSALLFTLPLPLCASDSWSECTSPDGRFQIVWDRLVEANPSKNETFLLGQKKKEVLIKKMTETCVLKNSKKRVVIMEEVTTFQVFILKSRGLRLEQDFICVRGGAGVPVDDSCTQKSIELTTTYISN